MKWLGPSQALAFDIPVKISVATASLTNFFSGHLISRWEGGLFFFYYLAYTLYIVLHATGSQLTNPLRDMMLAFGIPLTLVILAVTAYRTRGRSPNPPEGQRSATP